MRSTNLHKVALIFKEYMCSIHAKASPADSCSHASHGDNAVQRLCTLDNDDAANVPHIVDNNMAPHPCTLDDVATHAPACNNTVQSPHALDDAAPHAPTTTMQLHTHPHEQRRLCNYTHPCQ